MVGHQLCHLDFADLIVGGAITRAQNHISKVLDNIFSV
jgi:hypothetical protein